ncbi:MAG: BACON domain-containing protein [Bacteroidaceae bacterium]|nr:BACON domain-containing protein [Bacteroidaceae bacterium]
MNDMMIRHRFLTVLLMLTFVVNVSAQMSRADGLFADGIQLRQTFTVASQEAAIQKFKQAKIAYSSADRKTACDEQLEKCRSNIKRIQDRNNSRGRAGHPVVVTPEPGMTVEVVSMGARAEAIIDTENIEIWPDQNVKGELGLMVQMQLEIRGMKDKPCDVMISFSDEYGRPLKNKNNKAVILEEKITPLYAGAQWKNFKMAIPYSGLFLSGSGQKRLKLNIAVFDISGSKAVQLLALPSAETSFNYDDTFISVDNVQDEIAKEYTAQGGRTAFQVSTNVKEYEFVEVPSWCKIEGQTPQSFTLVCTPNEGTVPRQDYFEVKASPRKRVRIYVAQHGAGGASATINKVWSEEYLFFLTKGIRVHVDTKVNGLMDQEVYYSVLFYHADNKTPLLGRDGLQVTMSGSEIADFDETRWSDWYVSIPYQNFPKPSDGEESYTFDCVIKDASGNELARSRDHSFTLP